MRSAGNVGRDMAALGSDTTTPFARSLSDSSTPSGTFRVNPATASNAQIASRLAEAKDGDKEKEVRKAADEKIESRSSDVKNDLLENNKILKDAAKETQRLDALEKAVSSSNPSRDNVDDALAKIADARKELEEAKLPSDPEQRKTFQAEKKKLEALFNESEKILKDSESNDDIAGVILAVLNSKLKAAAALTNTPNLGAGLQGSKGSSKPAAPESSNSSGGGGGKSSGLSGSSGGSGMAGGGGGGGGVSSGSASTAGAGGVGPGQAGTKLEDLTPEQKQNAQEIIAVGRSMGMSDRDITIGLMTAMQESMLRNVNYGDRDSLGLFQQRPSQGWGTPAQVTDPKYAATKFFNGLKGIGNREGMALTAAAQAVQRSAFPDAYAKWQSLAEQLVVLSTQPGGLAAAPPATGAPGMLGGMPIPPQGDPANRA